MPGLIENLIHSKTTDATLDKCAEAVRKYFRIRQMGIKNLPKKGGVVLIANHSGYAGADALMICHLVHRDIKRIPKLMVHRAYFQWFDTLRRLAIAFGLEEVSVERGVQLLKKKSMVLIFPEGEAGNFKSSLKRYHLQHFHTGFVRMAVRTQVPIVPCLVIGAEESHINLGNIDLGHYIKGLRIPLPINLFPLPAKWRMVFLKPIETSIYKPDQAEDRELMARLSDEIRETMQATLVEELRKRKYVFLPMLKEKRPLATLSQGPRKYNRRKRSTAPLRPIL